MDEDNMNPTAPADHGSTSNRSKNEDDGDSGSHNKSRSSKSGKSPSSGKRPSGQSKDRLSRSLRSDGESSSRSKKRTGAPAEHASPRPPRPSGGSKDRSRRSDDKSSRRSKNHSGSKSVPGAPLEHASPRSSGGSKDRSRRSDEKSSYRSRSGSASVPGAQAEHASPRSSGRSSRSSRRSDEKSAHRSSRGPATVPGAQPELSSSPRSSRSRRSDEKSAYRSRSGSASVPGALAEQSSPKGRSKRDEKGKERRGTRASKPGAEASTSSRDRSKAKSSKENDVNVVSNNEDPPQFGEDEEPVIAAMIVEEEEKEDEDAKKEREQARINELVAAQAEQERQRLQEQNQRLQEEMERKEAERKDKEREAKKKRNMVICVVLVLVIGGGVAAIFALQRGSSSDPVNQPIDQREGTPSPSVATSTLPTVNPTIGPSSVPTDIKLKYEQPSPEECERIAAGLPIDGEQEMIARSFDIPMEVDLLDGNEMNALVPELETKIEKFLVPDLIGCSRELFDKRRLRHQPKANSDASMMSMVAHHRQLQSTTMSIRYAIAKAIVTVTLTGDACEKSSSPNCSVVAVNLDLTVRGDEKIIFLAGVLEEVFPNDKDIRPELELVAPFDTIVIGIMRPLDPTPSPTIAPTGTETETPSSSPSTSPTSGPGTVPTDPAPVVAPTKAPSKAPTQTPTLAPTQTPPPTFAPQPGLTPQPTPPPTLAPTPTPPPTFAPQPGLTPQPTPPPTARPTSVPSKYPSSTPSVALSSNPTIQASAAPSAAPTSGPTSAPTRVCGGNTVADYNGATLVGLGDFGVGPGTHAVDLGFGSFRWTNHAFELTYNLGNFDSHDGSNVWYYTNGDDCLDFGGRSAEVHLQFVSDATSYTTLSEPSVCRYRLDLYISTTTCALPEPIPTPAPTPAPTLPCGGNTVTDYEGATLVGPADFGSPGTQAVDLGFGSFRWTDAAGYTYNIGNFDSHDGSNVWYYTNGDDCLSYGPRTAEVHLQFVSDATSYMIATTPSACTYRVDLYISTTTCALPASIPTPGPTPAPTLSPPASPGTSRLGWVPLLRQGMYMDQSSIFSDQPASNALDGNYNTVAHTNLAEYTPFNTGTWWRINLEGYYGTLPTVNYVTVWNRLDCCQDRLEGAIVELWGAGGSNLIATAGPLTSDLVQTVNFGGVTGVQWIQVHQDSKNEYLNIAQVEAWGSVPSDPSNLAYTGLIQQGMYMDQSSTFSNQPAANAVDGNFNTVAHTDYGPYQHWRVFLQQYYGQLVTVKKVTVWNREDCCRDRLVGAVVLLFGAGSGNLIATSAPLTDALIQTVDFGEVSGVQVVQVQHNTRDEYLSIAQIEAWG